MRLVPRLLFLGLCAAAACGDNSGTIRDFALPIDMTASVDQSGGRDGGVPDLRGADLFGADLTVVDGGPPPTVVGHQRWVDFCKSFTACGFWGDSLSSCIAAEPLLGNLPFEPPTVLTCIHDAGSDCAAIKKCFNLGDPNVSCTSSSFVQSCSTNTSGDKVIYNSCISSPDGLDFRDTKDCSKLGLTCVQTSDPANIGCGFGACNVADNTEYCVSDFRTQCTGGRLEPIEDCRVFQGEKCMLANGVARCYGQGAACTADRCNGSTLVACKQGKESTFDCATLGTGMTCVTPTGGGARCGRGVLCDGTFMDSCVGAVLTYCDAGVLATVNCTAEGWTKCVPKDTSGGGFCSK